MEANDRKRPRRQSFSRDKEVEQNYGEKARSGDRVPDKLDPKQREIFPFRIFIKEKYLNEGIDSKSEREDIIRNTSIDDITMDNSIKVPDVPGSVMVIECENLQRREDALREVLMQIERIEKQNSNSDRKVEIELMTFVPEGLVSVTIGHKGRLISKIKDEAGVSVVIN